MSESKVIDFATIKTPEQIDKIIDELTDYKKKLENESVQKWRASVDEHVNDFMRFCETGDKDVYLFIPKEAFKTRVACTLNDTSGYFFVLESDSLRETTLDENDDIVCVMSEDV